MRCSGRSKARLSSNSRLAQNREKVVAVSAIEETSPSVRLEATAWFARLSRLVRAARVPAPGRVGWSVAGLAVEPSDQLLISRHEQHGHIFASEPAIAFVDEPGDEATKVLL